MASTIVSVQNHLRGHLVVITDGRFFWFAVTTENTYSKYWYERGEETAFLSFFLLFLPAWLLCSYYKARVATFQKMKPVVFPLCFCPFVHSLFWWWQRQLSSQSSSFYPSFCCKLMEKKLFQLCPNSNCVEKSQHGIADHCLSNCTHRQMNDTLAHNRLQHQDSPSPSLLVYVCLELFRWV